MFNVKNYKINIWLNLRVSTVTWFKITLKKILIDVFCLSGLLFILLLTYKVTTRSNLLLETTLNV